MIDDVLMELKNYRDDIDYEFQHWYDFAVRIYNDVCIGSGLPRLAKCWIRYQRDVRG